MRSPSGETSSAQTLRAQLLDACRVPTTKVFVGQLTYYSYSLNEMIPLVVPRGIADGAPVGLYWQWSVTDEGEYKRNAAINKTFRAVFTSDGRTTGTFSDKYYTY